MSSLTASLKLVRTLSLWRKLTKREMEMAQYEFARVRHMGEEAYKKMVATIQKRFSRK